MADLPINSSDAQPVNITDPTTQTQSANVKAGSTAAVAGDSSLVVALSPNSPVPAGTNAIGTVTAIQGTAAATTAGWPVTGGTIAESTAAWTSATALNTAVTMTVTGYTSVLVTLAQGTTITGGVVTFEVSDTVAFTNAYQVNAVPVNDPDFAATYTLTASTNQAFYVNVCGATAFRIRLSTVITGTGTVNVGVQANSLPNAPVISGAVNAEVFGTSGTNQLAVTTTAASGHQMLDVNVVPDPNAVPVGANISALVAANEVFTVATLLNQATSGSDNPLVLIKNPVGSGKTLYVYSLSLGCTVANVTDIFRLFADPTITTNGTTFTPVNNNVGNATTSVMTAFTLSTVSASGTALNTYTYGQNSNSVEILNDFSIHILAGHNLLITGNPASNSRQASVTIVWAEV